MFHVKHFWFRRTKRESVGLLDAGEAQREAAIDHDGLRGLIGFSGSALEPAPPMKYFGRFGGEFFMSIKFYASYGARLALLDLDINSDLDEMLRPIGDAIRSSIETIEEADKLEKLERIWTTDEECESIESWLGLAFVAAQTYLTRVISHCRRLHDWHEHQTKSRVLLGTNGAKHGILAAATPKVRSTSYTAVEAINAFANYFKHRDEWPFDWTQLQGDNEKQTATIIKAFGARSGSTGNLRQGYASILGDKIPFNEVARLSGIVRDWARSLKTAYEQELRADAPRETLNAQITERQP
jgi:hypothetical protein